LNKCLSTLTTGTNGGNPAQCYQQVCMQQGV
jgi:hypothetical protein